MGRKISDLVGQKVGNLTVVRLSHTDGSKSFWHCSCDCGKACIKSYVSLIQKRKNPLSCGCDLGYLKASCIDITYQGKTQSMEAWSEELGIAIHTLKKRYSRGGKENLDRLFRPVDPEASARAKKLVDIRDHENRIAKIPNPFTDDPRYPDLMPLNVLYYWQPRRSVQL